jgi:integrase
MSFPFKSMNGCNQNPCTKGVDTAYYSDLEDQQARTFLEAINGNRLETLFTVALSLGLRRGEALGLRWQDE